MENPETITIRGREYLISEKIISDKVLTRVPGHIVGARLLTDGMGGILKIYEGEKANSTEPIINLVCEKGRQERERILLEFRKYDAGLFVEASGMNIEGIVYYRPFDLFADLNAIRELLEEQTKPQWVHEHKYSLTTAKTDELIEEFPSGANYLYVKKCTGIVNVKFNSPNAPSWTLSERAKLKTPFSKLYLTWTAQSGEDLTLYVSNKDIEVSGQEQLIAKTTTALGANEAYTSGAFYARGFERVTLMAKSDKASATNGLKIQQSIDGTNWDFENTWTLAANVGRAETVRIFADYVRVQLTNGGTNQTTLRLAARAR